MVGTFLEERVIGVKLVARALLYTTTYDEGPNTARKALFHIFATQCRYGGGGSCHSVIHLGAPFDVIFRAY